jgi:hypothetical protein
MTFVNNCSNCGKYLKAKKATMCRSCRNKLIPPHKGHKVSKKAKLVMSKKRKKYFKTHETWCEGKHLTLEHKNKLSRAHMGKKLSEKHKQNISKSLIGKTHIMPKNFVPWNKNKHDWTTEERKAFGDKNRGKKQSKESIAKRVAKTRGKKRAPRSKEWREKLSKGLQGIPAWNKGKKLSKEHRKNLSKGQIKRLQSNKHYKMKYREDLDQYFRSKFEANYARYLKYNNILYEYESDKCVFELNNGRRYICDFYLPETNEYIELKGHMWKDSEEKIKIFQKKYYNIKWKLIMYESVEWANIVHKYFNIIPNWEHCQGEKYIGHYIRREVV